MRLQLTSRSAWLRRLARAGIGAALGLVAFVASERDASAQVAIFETAHTLYSEAPTRTNMTVYTPGATITVNPADWLGVHAGYEADIVSGASVSVKAGKAYQNTNPGVDVITTASVTDVRHSPRGGISLKKGDVTYNAEYTYSTEHDYKSHALFVSAKTDVYDHNTQFEISYARNFDLVCDRMQAVNDQPARFRAMEDSKGCFTGSDPLRTRHSLAIDGFQGSWTQAWTSVFATQLMFTTQLVNGFQSNPYRSVILAQGLKAQEHHPENRARSAVALRANLYVRPIKTAFRITGRAYRDTWDVTSGSGELEAERYLFEGFRLALRGRYYKQSGALFWSDDYTGGDPPLGPKGQYWTGDRELSPFSSVTLGARITYNLQPPANAPSGRILGIMTGLKLGASADVMQFSYDEYTLGGTPIENARAFILGLNLSALF